MRGRVAVVALSAAVMITLVAPALASSEATPAAPGLTAPPLSHVGPWLTDAAGRTVILHGLTIVPPVASLTPSTYLDEPATAAFLAENGFDAVRLGFYMSGIEPTINHYDASYIADFRHFQQVLAADGVLSLLDMHEDDYSPEFAAPGVLGRGFPTWMTETDGLPNEPAVDPYANPALEAADDNFWRDAPAADGVGLQQHFAGAWQQIVSVFAHAPGVLGYEILNEPWPGTQWPTCASPIGCPLFDRASLMPFTQKMVATLGHADPRHLIFYEPNLLFDFGADTDLGKINAPNLVFAFHDYCLGTIPGDPWPPDPLSLCSIDDSLIIGNAERYAAQTGDGLLLDEFGSLPDALGFEPLPTVAARIAAEADAAKVGWTFWAYDGIVVPNPGTPPTGANVDMPLLDALERPYPQAVAGTPTSWHFDTATHVFDLTYSTRMPDGRSGAHLTTDVFVPRLQYPDGYVVRVAGARVTSPRGASEVVLEASRGAKTVTLQITPRS